MAEPDPGTDIPRQLGDMWQEFMDQVAPSVEQTLDMLEGLGTIDDLRNYHPPERLPNGDIILRRREDAPDLSPDAGPDSAEPPAAPGQPAPITKI